MRVFHRLVLLGVSVSVCSVLTGCASSDGTPSAKETSTSPAAPSPSPSASTSTTPASLALADLARRGVATAFTATYELKSNERGQPDATVKIARLDTSYRVEIAHGAARAVLLTSRRGLVSCQLTSKKRVCLLVAGPGKAPPKLFDPGVQRLVTSDLEAFAKSSGLTIEKGEQLPAQGGLPAAQCFTVKGHGVDSGDYCLTEDGLLRQAVFPSGTLTMTKLGEAPTPRTFDAPVRPTPLPR